MLSAYENYGRKSGVTIVCDKTCRVLSGALWEAQLKDIQDTIVFVDEGSTFVSSLDFARAIQKTDNYYVLVTREDLSTLPYSVNAILELKRRPADLSGLTIKHIRFTIRSLPAMCSLEMSKNY